MPDRKPIPDSNKRPLIVSGIARSGTTILAKLLNQHSQICLGVERFKFEFLRKHNYDPGFLTKNRFFDFRESDTNILPSSSPTWDALYKDMYGKWDSALIVGDKIPDLTRYLGEILRDISDTRFIYIIRNVGGVAASWQARADNEQDSTWPSSKGTEVAIRSWEQQNDIMARHLERPHFSNRCLIISYEDVFLMPDPAKLDRIFSHLSIQPSQDVIDYYTESARPNQKAWDARADVTDGVRSESYLKLLKHAGVDGA